MEFSYFKLRLMVFLKESHPNKADNNQFIHERSKLATATYAGAIEAGQDHLAALKQANAELYRGLLFSKYDMLFEILSEEFTDAIEEEKIPQYALELLPLCETVFSKYSLDNGFADTPEYEKLYTELTGKIEAYGL